MIGCSCGASWPGTRISHCSACHETFTGIEAFDAHRRADPERATASQYVGRCLDPTEAKLVRVSRSGRGARGTVVLWSKPESAWMASKRREQELKGHNIDAGGNCRKPGCAWFSDIEEDRVHTDSEGDPL